tara:strand:+ start:23465 stop:24643 length:1179 start_codon:yes stop_codon:yes gene_type:complete
MKLLDYVKKNSPFYRKLWGHSPLDLKTLPIIDQEAFWDANTWENNQLLTAKLTGGVIFKSGGTTGRPKFSAFTKSEWEEFTKIFGHSMTQVLKPGDRVANLFYSGELYASFLFIEKSLEHCPVDVVTFPIAGATDLSEVVNLVRTYGINVLAGVPTTFSRLAKLLVDNNETLPLTKLLYGGETLFEDQRPLLDQAFNNPEIASIGYASVDAGHLGGSAPELGARAHYVLPQTMMQIVDEDDALIEEKGKAGRLVMTNLSRELMPIIRYPVGDLAKWIEPGKSFEILGRAQEGARIGPVTVSRDDVASVFQALKTSQAFQIVVKREFNMDLLIIRYTDEIDKEMALKTLLDQRKMLKDCIEKHLICLPRFEQVSELERNSRTGKLKFVLDYRF